MGEIENETSENNLILPKEEEGSPLGDESGSICSPKEESVSHENKNVEEDCSVKKKFISNLKYKSKSIRGTMQRRKRCGKIKKKPFFFMSWDERLLAEKKMEDRILAARKRRLAIGKPVAPYNTTQFIMNDHNDDNVEEVIHQGENERLQRVSPERRNSASEQSFSIDPNDVQPVYLSLKTEEQFIANEFSRTYETENAKRLENLNKSELINEFLEIEKRVRYLEKKTMEVKSEEEAKADTVDYEFARGEIPMEPDMAEKIRIFQEEIQKLSDENVKLRQEICGDKLWQDYSSSVDSESDSSSVSSSSGSSSSTCSSSSSSCSTNGNRCSSQGEDSS